MTGTQDTTISVARVHDGLLLRVKGSGTNRESLGIDRFLEQAVPHSAPWAHSASPPGNGHKPDQSNGDSNNSVAVHVDLSQCDYLDSTFMGCLLGLHKQAARGDISHFDLIAPSPACRKLLSLNRLDQIFQIEPECPSINGEELVLAVGDADNKDFGRHVMECHRRLADVDGPNQKIFAKIADQLSHEVQNGTAPT